MSYFATLHSLDTDHKFAFDESQIIGRAHNQGR